MNTNRASVHKEHILSHVCSMRCISWTAIIFGAIVAIGLSFLLNLLGLAVGLSAFPKDPTGQAAFAVGGFVGLVILAILAMYPAGWIAGFLGRAFCLKRKMGEVYGFGAWALSLILTIILAAHFGQFLTQANFLINRNVATIQLTDTVRNVTTEPVEKRQTPAANIKVNPETASETAGMMTFVTFFIFFIGALAACFGGRMGMSYHRGSRLNTQDCAHCE